MDTYTYTYAYTCIHIHIYICMCTFVYIYISISIAYAHPVASVKQMCTLMFKHLSNVHTCTCMVLNNTCERMLTLCKNAYGLVRARLYNGAAASLP